MYLNVCRTHVEFDCCTSSQPCTTLGLMMNFGVYSVSQYNYLRVC